MRTMNRFQSNESYLLRTFSLRFSAIKTSKDQIIKHRHTHTTRYFAMAHNSAR